MKVVVSGDRDWPETNIDPIRRRLERLPRPVTLLHGDCRGVDRLAAAIGCALGFTVIPYPAEWETYGNAAGPRRNTLMLDQAPDLLLAFHPNIQQSRGTADIVRKAMARGIPHEIITGREPTPEQVAAVAHVMDRLDDRYAAARQMGRLLAELRDVYNV